MDGKTPYQSTRYNNRSFFVSFSGGKWICDTSDFATNKMESQFRTTKQAAINLGLAFLFEQV